jgi:hypothetical protein
MERWLSDWYRNLTKSLCQHRLARVADHPAPRFLLRRGAGARDAPPRTPTPRPSSRSVSESNGDDAGTAKSIVSFPDAIRNSLSRNALRRALHPDRDFENICGSPNQLEAELPIDPAPGTSSFIRIRKTKSHAEHQSIREGHVFSLML